MHVRRWVVLIAALLLALAACSDGGGEDVSEGEASTDGDEATEGEELSDDELSELTPGEPSEPPEPVDLPNGLAATVDDAEIAEETVEERFEAVVQAPEVAEQIEGEDEEAVSEQIRAQILSRLILDRIVAMGADELGVEASEEDIAAREAEEAEAAGGEEEFAAQLEAQGIGPDQLEEELRTVVLLEEVQEEITGDLDDEAHEPDEETGISEADVAVQEWLFEQLETRDVAVDEEYGVWNAQSAQVMPTDSMG